MPDSHVKVGTTTPTSVDPAFSVRQVGTSSVDALSDGAANPVATGLGSFNLVWNATTWDRARGNIDGTALSFVERSTGTADSGDIINYEHRGVALTLDYSTGAAALVLRLQAKDPVSSKYQTLLSTASISANAVAIFSMYPGISAGPAGTIATGGSINNILPRTWKVTVLPSGSVTAGYSVGYSLIK